MTAAVPMPIPRPAAAVSTPVIHLRLAPKEALMATTQRRTRTITTQHAEEPVTIALGTAIRASDVAALIASVEEEARSTENAGEPWFRIDGPSEIVVGYTTETRS